MKISLLLCSYCNVPCYIDKTPANTVLINALWAYVYHNAQLGAVYHYKAGR